MTVALYGADALPRFFKHVRRTESCWLWEAGKTGKNQYGSFWYDGRTWRAHRWIAEQVHGPCPAGQEVRHTCDVAHCVNPDHLVYGTHQENVTDCVQRGRARGGSGSRHRSSVLDESDVKSVCLLGWAGVSFAAIGRRYGVGANSIKRLCEGGTWRHVPRPGVVRLAQPGSVARFAGGSR